MSKERIKQIKENVNRRNIINAVCGNDISTSDAEIMELLEEVERLNKIIDKLKDK